MTSPYAADRSVPTEEPLATPQRGQCVVCGHNPACGYASIIHDGREDWYCHGDCAHEVAGNSSCYEARTFHAPQLRTDAIEDAGAPSATRDEAGQSHPTPGEKT